MRSAPSFRLPLIGAFLVALNLAACGTTTTAGSGLGRAVDSLGSIVTPYKVEIVQGNVLTKEQVSLLQKGLNREQVRNILGSPLVTSAFHADRWDYVFTIQRQGIPAQERRYTLKFKGDELESFSGDEMPGEVDFVAALVGTRNLGKVPELSASEDRLKAFAAANAQPARPTPAPAANIRTDYPPLEGPPLAAPAVRTPATSTTK